MNIRLNKGAIVALASASLIAGSASASEVMSVRDLGTASSLRSSLIKNAQLEQSAPYLGSEHKEGEGKCGEGKCGEGKCGDDTKKESEGKCGEGKCGE